MAKLWLINERGNTELNLPREQEGFVTMAPQCTLGACKGTHMRIQGRGPRIAADDRAYVAEAYTECCNRHVGTMRYEPDTIFGIREDEAVLNNGRARVY